MEVYLFDRIAYNQLYNCSYLTADQWQDQAVYRPVLGLFCALIGIIYMSTYVPCLIVMSRRSFRKNSCYKIMLQLAVVDVTCIPLNCFLTAYLAMDGSMFCLLADVQYIAGAILCGGWVAQCMCCMILAVNRCLTFWSQKFVKIFFEGHRTYYWMMLPAVYAFYFTFFTLPVTFNSSAIMWSFDIYAAVPLDVAPVDHVKYVTWQTSYNNAMLIVVLGVLYTSLSVSLWLKRKEHSGYKSAQLKITRQAALICLLNFIPAIIFASAQFVPVTPAFLYMCMFTWQASNGGAGVIYLTLNKTMRTQVLDMKRRELTMWVVLNIKENLCGFELLERPVTSITTVPLSDLHSKYDRITKVNFINSPKGQTEGYQAMPFNEALNKISLALRFASNCELEALADNRYAIVFFKPFFKLLGRSQTFKSVRTPNYGEECEEFVRKQLKSAHLEQLLLYRYWPVGFKKSIASWTQNPKFRSLYSDSMVKMLGYKTVVSLLQRWADGELKELSTLEEIRMYIERIDVQIGQPTQFGTFI
ncbi:hypothetical protein QR680_016423 [Steinernema hermaphroditum]|uniref:Uncharacterized protein n=1 Tax=Steinernema hermaphroditum TaxID=289476 RepID=A0AA39HDB8_9BILA|nr:hypothetical protein QR680_016423 [Steinernema hermaphroditum]